MEETEREEKKSKWFIFPSFIKNLEKACTRGGAVNTEACNVIHLIFIQYFLYRL